MLIVYLHHIFYAPLGIGGPPIPGAMGDLSFPSAIDLFRLEVVYMLFVSTARRYLVLLLSLSYRVSTCYLYRRPADTWRYDYLLASRSYPLEVGYIVFISAARRYDPEGIGGLGTNGQGKQGEWSLRRIGGLPIPPLTFHIKGELVSADRRYQVFHV